MVHIGDRELEQSKSLLSSVAPYRLQWFPTFFSGSLPSSVVPYVFSGSLPSSVVPYLLQWPPTFLLSKWFDPQVFNPSGPSLHAVVYGFKVFNPSEPSLHAVVYGFKVFNPSEPSLHAVVYGFKVFNPSEPSLHAVVYGFKVFNPSEPSLHAVVYGFKVFNPNPLAPVRVQSRVKMEGGIQGLVIVFSACMVQVLAFGNYACVGIYNVYLLEEFDNDNVGVSLISSIHFALLLGCGPFISFLMTKVSYRTLSVLGATLVFIGILGTHLIIHLPSMYLFFGVFAGLGGCFIYLPSHVLSGLYYEKYRSLSTGVATTGTGLGAIIMPVIVGNLIEEYTWKGSLLILAGLDLHLLVFALLMIPPQSSANTDSNTDDELRMSEILDKNNFSSSNIAKHNGADWSTHNTYYEASNHNVANCYDYNPKTKDKHAMLLNTLERQKSDVEISCQNGCHNSSILKHEERNIKRRSKIYSSLPDDDISFVLQPSYLSWATNLSIRSSRLYENIPEFVMETDIIAESEPNIPMCNNYKNSLPYSTSTKAEPLRHKTLKETLKHHFLLFMNLKFLIYFFSTLLWSLSTVIFVTFGPELIYLKGQTKYDTAIVFTFFGVGQLVGSIFISILGNCIGKRVFLYIISNSLTGVFIGILPLYDSYAWIVMICLCSGLAYGGILGLYMIVMVDIVGVDDMEIGLGYIMLASGIGCFAGPPLCGYIKEIYDDYNSSFYLAGILPIVAGLCMVLIYLKCCKEKEPREARI
ncbi:hypothetical protein Btru_008153 [Bulinus truncatus]|nr:hypothetical protein Btru_008153 [Bulinus truncatus]